MTVTEQEAPTFGREEIDAARAELDAASPEELVENADGSFQLLVGGKEPTTQKVRLYGGAIEVEPPDGGFKKGQSYVLRVEVMCNKAGFTDEIDGKTHQVVGCSDERGLKIRGVAVVA
jgi:hypothetical protein